MHPDHRHTPWKQTESDANFTHTELILHHKGEEQEQEQDNVALEEHWGVRSRASVSRRFRRRLFAIGMIGIALALSVVAAAAIGVCKGEKKKATPALQAHIESILNARGGNGSWSIAFHELRDSDGGDDAGAIPLLVDVASTRLHTPASATKLLTAAAVWVDSDLMAEAKNGLKTTSLATVSRATADSLSVALTVVGGGDPSLSSTRLRALARETAESLSSIASSSQGPIPIYTNVSVDTSLFAPGRESCMDASWEVEDIDAAYGALVDALMVDDGCAVLTCETGEGGSIVACSWDFETSAVQATVRETSTRGGTDLSDQRLRWLYSRLVGGYVGTGRLEGDREQFTLPVFDPAQHAIEVFIDELRQHPDVHVSTTASDSVTPPSAAGEEIVLGELRSQPLPEIIRHMLLTSSNQYAETLLLLLGGGNGRAAALERVRVSLAALAGVSADEMLQHDGSGLSRHNFVSAIAFVKILKALAHGSFYELLTKNCEDGSLGGRLCGLPPGVAIAAKTGTMTGVVSLSGYVLVDEKRAGVFSVSVNNSEFSSREARAVIDECVRAFAEHISGRQEKNGLQ